MYIRTKGAIFNTDRIGVIYKSADCEIQFTMDYNNSSSLLFKDNDVRDKAFNKIMRNLEHGWTFVDISTYELCGE